jgi:rubrerythrin
MAYNIQEIIDIAVGIEDAGYEFYIHCIKKFNDAAIRDVFDFLAREEQRHKKLFQSLSAAGELKGYFTEEYFAYLKAIGGGRIFEKQAMNIDQIMAGILNPMDAIKHAFNAEKESILFYTELKQLYENDPATMSLLNNIIGEERKHIATLLDLLEKIRLIS